MKEGLVTEKNCGGNGKKCGLEAVGGGRMEGRLPEIRSYIGRKRIIRSRGRGRIGGRGWAERIDLFKAEELS